MSMTANTGPDQGAGQQQQQAAGQQGQAGQQQAGQQTAGQAGAQQQAQTSQQAAGTQQAAGQQAQQQTGQQQAQGTDELTPEEEAALGDPGKRALARVKDERNTLREQHTAATAELEQTRTQLQAALAQIAAGGDQAQQQALQTATTERDKATTELARVNAVLRNGVAMPQQGEQPAAWAARVQQIAGLLQGDDAAALDNSARVLLSLAGGGQAPAGQQQQVQQVTTGDTSGGAAGGGQAGDLSMSDRIRAAAGRRVR